MWCWTKDTFVLKKELLSNSKMQHFSRYQCVFTCECEILICDPCYLYCHKNSVCKHMELHWKHYVCIFWVCFLVRSIQKKISVPFFHFFILLYKIRMEFSITIYTKASFYSKLPGHIRDCCSLRIWLVSFISDHCLVSSPSHLLPCLYPVISEWVSIVSQ